MRKNGKRYWFEGAFKYRNLSNVRSSFFRTPATIQVVFEKETGVSRRSGVDVGTVKKEPRSKYGYVNSRRNLTSFPARRDLPST